MQKKTFGPTFISLWCMGLDENYGSPDRFYSDFYQSVICNSGAGGKSVRSTHRKMEAKFRNLHFERCLELGGGNGEHLNFIQHDYDTYFLLDTRTPSLPVRWASDSKICPVTGDATEIPFPDDSFNRVIVTCLLHHVSDSEKVLNEIKRVLAPKGVATIFLPCDPGILVRFARKLTTSRNAQSRGFLGYDLMISREHRNHVGGLLTILKFVFRDLKVNFLWYPFRFPSWNLNAYVIVDVYK